MPGKLQNETARALAALKIPLRASKRALEWDEVQRWTMRSTWEAKVRNARRTGTRRGSGSRARPIWLMKRVMRQRAALWACCPADPTRHLLGAIDGCGGEAAGLELAKSVEELSDVEPVHGDRDWGSPERERRRQQATCPRPPRR